MFGYFSGLCIYVWNNCQVCILNSYNKLSPAKYIYNSKWYEKICKNLARMHNTHFLGQMLARGLYKMLSHFILYIILNTFYILYIISQGCISIPIPETEVLPTSIPFDPFWRCVISDVRSILTSSNFDNNLDKLLLRCQSCVMFWEKLAIVRFSPLVRMTVWK